MNVVNINGWCKRCGICAALCPAKVFAWREGERPEAARQGRCTGCKLCELCCPDFAIRVEVAE